MTREITHSANAAMPSGAGLLVPGQQVGNVQVLELVLTGSVRDVWLGHDQTHDRQVALKVLRPEWAAQRTIVSRFLALAESLRSLRHPNAASILGFGEQNGVCYLIEEYLQFSLGQRIKRDGAVSLDEAVIIAIQALDGLGQAWAQGLVHGNVNSDTIMLDSQGRVRVTDFGLTSIVRQGSSRGGQTVFGSPEYMSPEVCVGGRQDYRADIYSLGITFYEMLTGRVPFAGGDAREIMASQIREPLPLEPEHFVMADGRVADLLEAMTAKDPGDRPGSHQELRRALETVLGRSVPVWPSDKKPVGEASEVRRAPEVPPVVDAAVNGSLEVAAEETSVEFDPTGKYDFAALRKLADESSVVAAPRPSHCVPSETAKPKANLYHYLPLLVLAALLAGALYVVSSGRSGKHTDQPAEPGPGTKAVTTATIVSVPAPMPILTAAIRSSSPAVLPLKPVGTFAAPLTPARTAPVASPVAVERKEIIVDDADGKVLFQPADEWRASLETAKSYRGKSMVAPVAGGVKTATFRADIPAPGAYELQMYWVQSGEAFRSRKVLMYVNGAPPASIDQVADGGRFITIGTYQFPAGTAVPIVTLTTGGIVGGPTTHVSVDAIKLIPK